MSHQPVISSSWGLDAISGYLLTTPSLDPHPTSQFHSLPTPSQLPVEDAKLILQGIYVLISIAVIMEEAVTQLLSEAKTAPSEEPGNLYGHFSVLQ